MNHTLAQQTNTLDKYLLDELTPEERAAFEEHMFDCADCAARAKSDFEMISGLREVLGEPSAAVEEKPAKHSAGWLTWLRTWNFAPAFAAAALACIVGYQNLVSIPALREPQVLDTVTVVSTTRGSNADAVALESNAKVFAANFEVVAPKVGETYVCQFRGEDNRIIASINCGKHATSEFTLTVLLPTAKFQAGRYTMTLSPASAPAASGTSYAFSVKSESK